MANPQRLLLQGCHERGFHRGFVAGWMVEFSYSLAQPRADGPARNLPEKKEMMSANPMRARNRRQRLLSPDRRRGSIYFGILTARISISTSQPSTTRSAISTTERTGFSGFSSVPKNCW